MQRFLICCLGGLALTAVALAAASEREDSPPAAAPIVEQLDCGSGKRGTKAAFRQFMSVLRTGDETAVRAVLANDPEFAWISAAGGRGDGPPNVYEKHPDPAAAEVARVGGFPIEITYFYNVDTPARTTDAGFKGTWGSRYFIGKGALNCRDGTAIVLSVAVKKRELGP